MKKKSKGCKYVLTIAYKHGQDRCEYIQEEIIDETDDTSWEVYKLELKDYFEDTDIAGFTCCIIGKA